MSQTPLADALARISQEEFQRYLTEFRPYEDQARASLDKSTVGQAMDTAQGDAVRARASLGRMRERYGASVNPMQAQAEARSEALSGSLGQLTAANNAVVSDRDNRLQTMAGIVENGNTLRQQALGNFSGASALEGSRVTADRQAKAQYKAQKSAERASTYQTVGSLAAVAAMAAFMM